jgi:signal transduction histidine kinase
MSHDLRTPLNAIAGYADLMALRIHGELTPEQETDVARITRSARHLLSLINDILNYAKVESGKLNLEVVALPVADVMTALEEVVFPQVHAKGLTIDLHVCDGVVRADREKLHQILLNLVTNAIKFTAAGGRIEVRCGGTDSTIRIEVADTGAGIAANQLDRIFEPFIQVSRSLTNVGHEGVGLGLSISRDLARAMGGDISVQSVVGEGSVFAVTLPGGVR